MQLPNWVWPHRWGKRQEQSATSVLGISCNKQSSRRVSRGKGTGRIDWSFSSRFKPLTRALEDSPRSFWHWMSHSRITDACDNFCDCPETASPNAFHNQRRYTDCPSLKLGEPLARSKARNRESCCLLIRGVSFHHDAVMVGISHADRHSSYFWMAHLLRLRVFFLSRLPFQSPA